MWDMGFAILRAGKWKPEAGDRMQEYTKFNML